jgi:predicted dienelactone hydrolase
MVLKAVALRLAAVIALILYAATAHASVGLIEIEGSAERGPVTVFYPSNGEAAPLERGPFKLEFALQAAPLRGNGRLIVISHGSPGMPWVHTDLARALVEAGFVVAFPEHHADNYKDDSAPGPESWKRRPKEISEAIDVIARDARFAPLLALDKVGMFGMSAGGHTALTLAGGRWSPDVLRKHCQAHIADDFQTCAGLSARLTGGMLDGLKKRIVLWVQNGKLDDTSWYTHTDPRIAAIVAGVPFAADFDLASLAAPRIPLGIVTARQDKWLVSRFHAERILQACAKCERLEDIETGGHGALLSPLPPGFSGLLADLVGDPAGFDRATQVPELNRRITAFFRKHLLSQDR